MDTSLYSFPALLFFSPFFCFFLSFNTYWGPYVGFSSCKNKQKRVREKETKENRCVLFVVVVVCMCVWFTTPSFFFSFLLVFYTQSDRRCVLYSFFFSSANFSGDLRQILRERLLFLFLRAPPAFLFYIIPRLSFPLCVAVVVYLFVCCVRVLGSLCIYVLQLRKE